MSLSTLTSPSMPIVPQIGRSSNVIANAASIFYILGASTGTFDNGQSLNYINPPRRDVAMLPANWYMILAFVTDNPGAWLMHCHVAWHIDLGLGAQFLERADEIPGTLDDATKWDLTQQCASWNSYGDDAVYRRKGVVFKLMLLTQQRWRWTLGREHLARDCRCARVLDQIHRSNSFAIQMEIRCVVHGRGGSLCFLIDRTG